MPATWLNGSRKGCAAPFHCFYTTSLSLPDITILSLFNPPLYCYNAIKFSW
ncbi:hypothetical protein QWZ13_09240 [Reinekea marina]|uniref:hypothetical protein n=1 Tax=Reinekea marina TaxID=1310421 RepID=UPI0025B55954|nr:hypothetical protein [Reinekea marina]MDN3649092.1 hypothetical protein [Reinekea marina]